MGGFCVREQRARPRRCFKAPNRTGHEAPSVAGHHQTLCKSARQSGPCMRFPLSRTRTRPSRCLVIIPPTVGRGRFTRVGPVGREQVVGVRDQSHCELHGDTAASTYINDNVVVCILEDIPTSSE